MTFQTTHFFLSLVPKFIHVQIISKKKCILYLQYIGTNFGFYNIVKL